jgi:molybdate transport system permease protein
MRWFPLGLTVALALALTFLTLPVVAIFVNSSPGDLLDSLGDGAARDALWLSVRCTAAALAIIVAVGTPAAYLLATRSFPGKAIVVTLIELPLVLPPAVAGIGLLMAFGRRGLLGHQLALAGISIPFTRLAVVMAMTFVASPLYIRQAVSAFEAVDGTLLEASRTLGAGSGRTFRRVALPLAGSGLGTGMALGWARAVGEFGATIIFAGSLTGVTRTAPIEIYLGLSDNLDAGLATAAVLIAASGGVLLTVKLLGVGRARRFTPL